MTDWMLWLALTVVLVIFELFTGTFYLLMIAIGLAAGGIAALAGAGMTLQLAVAAVVGTCATLILHRRRMRRATVKASRDPNVNLDIGQMIEVDAWETGPAGICTARVRYRGAPWDVQLEPGMIAKPGPFVIREIRGSWLIVANLV